MDVKLDHIEDINDQIKTFWWQPPKKIEYIAGQYIEVHLPHENVDKRGDKRWFTLSSSPTEELLANTTRFSEPSSTFKNALKNLKPGAKVHMSMPSGDFVLPKDVSIPVIFVVGGIGVTPVRSIIKFLSDTNQKRDIKILHAARQAEDLIYKDLFNSYNLKYIPLIDEAKKSWHGLTGRLSVDLIEDIFKISNHLIYISGPESLVEALVNDFKGKINEHQLVTDYFPGYSVTS